MCGGCRTLPSLVDQVLPRQGFGLSGDDARP
jgi:hypothetical protein